MPLKHMILNCFDMSSRWVPLPLPEPARRGWLQPQGLFHQGVCAVVYSLCPFLILLLQPPSIRSFQSSHPISYNIAWIKRISYLRQKLFWQYFLSSHVNNLNMLSRQPPKNSFMDDSVQSTHRRPIDTRPFTKHPRVQKSRLTTPSGSYINQSSINVKEEVLRAIRSNQTINKLQPTQQFLSLLANQHSMDKVVIISIWGSPQSGKSFFIDTLLSSNDNITLRVFSKSPNQGANCSLRRISTHEGNPIIFLDWQGIIEANEEIQTEMFLLMYLISSGIVFNYSSNDIRYEIMFIEYCQKIKSKLISDEVEYSLPQLISIRRDVTTGNNRPTNFVESIYKLELFQPNANLLYLPYPGEQGIQANELIDVPIQALDKHFIKTCGSILNILKNLKPMYINDNPITGSMLVVLLGGYASMINRYQRVVIDTCWKSVLEALAVNGYNHFISIYTQNLQRQFKDQKALTRYQLFQKLFKVKSDANYKLQNFTNIRGDPIFDKYKERLQEFIKGKEEMIRSINASKSNLANTKFITETKRVNLPANQPFKEEKLLSFVSALKSLPQDYNRSELVLTTMKDLMQNQLKRVGNKAEAPQLKSLSQELENKNRQFEQRLADEIVNVAEIEKKVKQTRGTNERYQTKIQEKESDLRSIVEGNIKRDRERREAMTSNQREAEAKLQQLQLEQNQELDKQNRVISSLHSDLRQMGLRLSEQEKERAEVKRRIEKNDQELRELARKTKEREKLLGDRNSEISRLQELLARPQKKKTTCGCFG